ncbi:MAG TPA: FAD-dependent oxidoreductase [Thermoanaerobaculaceae bacterium]|nr:FAD-dependent oxidoreductase [Thermoanaerobaculaceae bacterium]HRS14819.1 FAD-dependent oxidoreductase [Thermoanaerobaculaceae bacterium]
MTRVVVLGAGLTGLSAALHLRRRGIEPLVLEREDIVGGACRTLERDGFAFDLTGHLLHLGQEEGRRLVAELGLAPRLRRHTRRAGVALAGTVTPYPIQINTFKLPPTIRRECLLGLLAAREHPEAPETGPFADWALSRFGDGLCRHFFFPYNQKLFCADARDFTAAWVGRFVPRPRLEDVVDGALGLFRRPVGYNATFLYPRRGGIRLLADTLARHVPGLRPGCPVRRVHLGERTLELASGEALQWDVLVATAALPQLCELTDDLPAEARAAASRLRAVAVLNLNLGVEGRPPRREHWLYVPEPRYPFYRVGIPSNHGVLAPPGCHTLSVEVSVPAGTPCPRRLWERCLDGLEELGLLRPERVVARVEARVDPGYVVFDEALAPAVAALRAAYAAAGVRLAGRWAEWKYSSMEDALLDGAAAAAEVAA